VPSALESAALLLRLHGSPMYFYKKGKGPPLRPPADALKAALASVERKRQQALAQARYMEQLARFELPDEFKPRLNELLYQPDRNTIEVKALEQAASAAGLSTAHLLEKCGAIPSSRDYHLNRFLLEHFPAGRGFTEADAGEPPKLADLPVAEADAFSIDDSTTTEIDDAFSVRSLGAGGWEIGIHIAAPALGIAPGSALDRLAASRLSTVYMPGDKITMLPQDVIERSRGRRPLCRRSRTDVVPDLRARTRSVVEQVEAPTRHDVLGAVQRENHYAEQRAFLADALHVLWFAAVLEAAAAAP
jgi:exoribonuclease-2